MKYLGAQARGTHTTWIVAAGIAVISTVAVASHLGPRSHGNSFAEASWVTYPTIREAVAAEDAVLAITVTSVPYGYADFGADGRPDFPGEKPQQVELVKARVTSVIAGDSQLAGTDVLVAQPAANAPSGAERQLDRMTVSSHVVIIASQREMNPSVAAGAMAWVPLPLGQGVFEDLGDGSVSPRSSTVYRNDRALTDRMPRSVFTQ